MVGINLDVILGELEPKPLTYKNHEFTLPAELPASVLAPFLDENLGLVELVTAVIADAENEAGVGDMFEDLVSKLKDRPRLPIELIEAAKSALSKLLDSEKKGQAAEFFALDPSISAYAALAGHLFNDYAFGLTDFFGSPSSSAEQEETAGDDSSATSPTTTPASTLEASGESPETPAS